MTSLEAPHRNVIDDTAVEDEENNELAQDVVDDLDALDSSSDEEEEENENKTGDGKDKTQVTNKQDITNKTNESTANETVIPTKSLANVAKLRKNPQFISHVEGLKEESNKMEDADSIVMLGGKVYNLVMDSNRWLVEIDEEITNTFRYLQDIYVKKMPELASIVKNPVKYCKTVLIIKNEMDLTQVDLSDILPSATVMIVTVTGSTTTGTKFTDNELKEVLDTAQEILSLENAKQNILTFVEERMHIIAPNVSALLGTTIAAELLAASGGLNALTKVPACNLMVIGKVQTHLSGFSSSSTMRHTGIVYNCPLVQSCPVGLRKKAMRVVTARVALASRLDTARQHHNQGESVASQGKKWHDEIKTKIEQWQIAGPGKAKRALPVPDAKPKKRRGGRESRRRKERVAMTDMRKDANRMGFGTGDDEYGDSAMGVSLGMLGKEGSGQLRISKKEKKLTKRKAINSGTVATSGLASSLAFTPVQGFELANPEAVKKVKEANMKYFASSKGFTAKK